jgi:hypothetical protein
MRADFGTIQAAWKRSQSVGFHQVHEHLLGAQQIAGVIHE